jgi:putative Holliday junction resolvase
VRVLGVDVGGARTGLALSDPVGLTCRPLDVIRERDPEKVMARILRIAEEEHADVIVVGLPRPLSGGSNEQMEAVKSFVGDLTSRARQPVLTWDERFTSKLARGSRPKGEPEDSVAACYMLQGFLDHRAQSERKQN